MNILVVDDEKLIRDVIREYLEMEGYHVLEAEDGKKALSIFQNNNISLVIMDIMMPVMDGYTACKEIKQIREVPFIMLSARSEEYDKLIGFDLGIDDYVTKPFSPKELVARVKAILKRDNGGNVLSIAGIKIDDLAHEVYVDHELITLTPKEYDLLKFLIKNKNIALSREKLLSSIWGYDFYGDDRTIDTHIKTLRLHLGKYRDIIKTVRGMGYKIEYKEED